MQPSRPSRVWGRLVAAGLAASVLFAAVVGYLLLSSPARRTPVAAPPASRPAVSATPAPTSTPSDPAGGPGAPTDGSIAGNTGPLEPVLKAMRPVRVVGPVFSAGESTFTMSYMGWPFAWRVPGTWGCMGGTVSLPHAKGFVCVDESNSNAHQRLHIMFRPCPRVCTVARQRGMAAEWFETPGRRPVVTDATTSYLETMHNANGKYALSLSHFFPAVHGGPPYWQVGAYVDSPPATRSTVQKIINEVRTQATA